MMEDVTISGHSCWLRGLPMSGTNTSCSMSASDSSAFFSSVPDMISSWNLAALTGALTVLIMYRTVTGARGL